MKRILIIEDETLSANRLKRLLGDYDDTLQVEGPLTSVEETIRFLQTQGGEIDLIFSDIRLGGQLVFEAFYEVMPQVPVIFTTAYDEYALEAFRHNGIDYLLKPIDPEDLAKAIKKVGTLAGGSNGLNANVSVAANAERLTSAAHEIKCYRERLLVSRGDELIPLRTDSISYIRKEDDWVMVYTRDGESYRIMKTMNELEAELNPDRFFRLNRQYLALIDSIQKISLFFSSKLIVRLQGCPDDQIVISKERSSQFKTWLDR